MFHIIDDEEIVRTFASEVLKDAGYEAVAYANPLEYLEFVNADGYIMPVAIITDVRMPQMSGYQLMDKIRETYPDQRFVVISGFDGTDATSQKRPCHFLAKPFLPNKLLDIAMAIEKCEQEGPSAGRSTCKPLVDSFTQSKWNCPLDCLDCDVEPATRR
ncbi:C4-dicarboxylate transport transcriptional regulatory protein DctD [Mariprofundus micogutta]|uniref:C4-dicarboxylate transport transcriptional regulatory protein DctD n=1 Tax=Mariprofundus micogutta TaxID=1921010 RepID=A0A1L8CQX2_9PROT|nr:response regulator [Mariprofundus micogutta]GAV21293.1 C4-dicarboxylate transport transcriptional regulatory protein DctD [Mariprofundus micogutta]